MHSSPSLFARRFFIIVNLVVAVIFLITCLGPYLNPQKWWYISMLGLAFGPLFLLLLIFIFFWLIAGPRYVFISIISLALGFKNISVFFSVSNAPAFNYTKQKNTLRVATWNVARFIELRRNNNKGSQTRLRMMELIKEQKADVLCMQEFYHSTDTMYYNNLDYIRKELGYPFHYYSWDGDGYLQYFGQVIFSKYPIVDSGIVHYPRPGMPESLIQADVLFGKDTIRFYTTHLQSFQFKKGDYEKIEKIKKREDSLLYNSRNIFSKLKKATIYRARQADIVKEIIDNSPHPYIIAGDFNDVPNSYTYFTIRGSLQDAFLKKGFGIGRTFSGIAPTLRIDYILATPHFSVLQFNRVIKNYSDHYMLVADVQLKK
ncbi:MAG: endonuclease/exonuclease/phosphatase family protein [Chitinophagaceae bacterium]